MLRRITARLHHDEGLTLVEMIVALFILGVILMALASTLVTSLRAIVSSEYRLNATQLANEILEELHAWDWDDLEGYLDPDEGPGAEQEHTRGNVDYDVTVDISWVDADETAVEEDYRRFEVEVSWTQWGGGRSLVKTAIRAPGERLDFGLRTSSVEPNLGYLRDNGRIEKPESGDAQHVLLYAETTAPMAADSVWVEYVDRYGAEQTVLLTGSADNTVWQRLGSGAWRFRNGDTTFRFIAENFPGDRSEAVIVTRYVHETIDVPSEGAFRAYRRPEGAEPDDPFSEEVAWLCVNADGHSVEDVTLRVGMRGMTSDDSVTIEGGGVDAEGVVFGVLQQEEADGTATTGTVFEAVISEGHDYPGLFPAGVASFTATAQRGFDGATGPASGGALSLPLVLGEAGCDAP